MAGAGTVLSSTVSTPRAFFVDTAGHKELDITRLASFQARIMGFQPPLIAFCFCHFIFSLVYRETTNDFVEPAFSFLLATFVPTSCRQI